MDKRQNNLITPLIDELAANVVLLDLSSDQDAATFKALLERLRLVAQGINAQALVEAADFLSAAFLPAISAGQDKIQKILTCWISVVRDYLLDEEQYLPPRNSLFQSVKTQVDETLAVSNQAISVFDSDQAGTFREVVENGFGFVTDIEKMLLGLEKNPQDEIKKQLFLGTIVAKGRGKAQVTLTGMQTRFGQIALSLSQIKEEKTPLKPRRLRPGRAFQAGCMNFRSFWARKS